MPTLSPQERLQPALLDRLIDDDPDKKQEPREARLITLRRLREAVLRDLAWLFNCTAPGEETLDPVRFPQAANSTLAFGLPPLAGNTATSLDISVLERRIRDAIVQFEPRLVPSTLRIRAVNTGSSMDHHNQIQVEIRGSLWSVPVPIEMLLRTNLDLESGEIRVEDAGS
jgi:type VI secretion system protein ImpF